MAIVAVKVCLSSEPPQSRIFDTDGKGNLIDRERWKEAQEIADGDISPEGRQSSVGERRKKEAERTAEAEVTEEAEELRETAAFEELLRELERPDPQEADEDEEKKVGEFQK